MTTSYSLSINKPTIIIAAHNEEKLISDTLLSLGSGESALFQIVVVCNGCNDKTVHIIETQFPKVHCQTLDIASKALAIRHAETLNIGFPRLYLDADIRLAQQQAQDMFEQAQSHTQASLFIPQSVSNTKTSSWLVKTYYQAWYTTGYVKQLGFGSGAYMLNKAARERFGLWPNIISDDGYLRTQFSHNEIIILKSVCVEVRAPKTLSSLIKIKTRSKFGNVELKKTQSVNTAKENQQELTHDPMPFMHKVVYSVVNIAALLNAYWNIVTGSSTWHRDDSNR